MGLFEHTIPFIAELSLKRHEEFGVTYSFTVSLFGLRKLKIQDYAFEWVTAGVSSVLALRAVLNDHLVSSPAS